MTRAKRIEEAARALTVAWDGPLSGDAYDDAVAAAETALRAALALPEEESVEGQIVGYGMIGTSIELTVRVPSAPVPVRMNDRVRLTWPTVEGEESER